MKETFEQAELFLNALDLARKAGVEYEFVAYFLRDLDITNEQLNEAIYYTLKEWDIA